MNISLLPDISILVPAYNEIGTIAEILDLIGTALPGVRKEIIVVDDGSKDGTRDWLSGKYATTSEEDLAGGQGSPVSTISDECTIRVIFHSGNKGKGGAIRTAMRAATGAVLIIQDADLEYDPGDWNEMYRLIARKKVADVVYGSRFHGKSHRSLYFHHYLANRLISVIFNVLCNQTLTDIETCYKMFTREVLNSLNITANDFGMEVQISCQIALARKWRVYETAIHYYGRTYQEGKKINWKDGLKALWYLGRYRVNPGN